MSVKELDHRLASKVPAHAFRKVVSSPHDGPISSASMARRSRRQAMAEMKGSRYGENLMRGLRKLTIASLPLILLPLEYNSFKTKTSNALRPQIRSIEDVWH